MGAKVNATNERGLNVMHLAAQADQPASLVYFKHVHGMSVSQADNTGSTVLHWACYSGSESAVNYILSWEPLLDSTDSEGLTSLHLAVVSGYHIKRQTANN